MTIFIETEDHKSSLNEKQIEKICKIFKDRNDQDQVFELFHGYLENRHGPEYYNWRLLIDELGRLKNY